MAKRITAYILTAALFLSAMPMLAFAADVTASYDFDTDHGVNMTWASGTDTAEVREFTDADGVTRTAMTSGEQLRFDVTDTVAKDGDTYCRHWEILPSPIWMLRRAPTGTVTA